jgi:hypothetical protein
VLSFLGHPEERISITCCDASPRVTSTYTLQIKGCLSSVALGPNELMQVKHNDKLCRGSYSVLKLTLDEREHGEIVIQFTPTLSSEDSILPGDTISVAVIAYEREARKCYGCTKISYLKKDFYLPLLGAIMLKAKVSGNNMPAVRRHVVCA